MYKFNKILDRDNEILNNLYKEENINKNLDNNFGSSIKYKNKKISVSKLLFLIILILSYIY